MNRVGHLSDQKVIRQAPIHKSILTTILGPRLLSPGYSLLPEEKLALSLSLLLLIAAVILFV